MRPHTPPTGGPTGGVTPHSWAHVEALTLYMWANSISKGVSRERGGGFTVTEMTLEFRTVVFLGGVSRPGQGVRDPFCEARGPFPARPPPLPPPSPPAGLPHTPASHGSLGAHL